MSTGGMGNGICHEGFGDLMCEAVDFYWTFDDDQSDCACDVAFPDWIGDGFCHDGFGNELECVLVPADTGGYDYDCDGLELYNSANCGWDGGDCCASTCQGAECGTPYSTFFYCSDPDAN